MQDAYFLYHSIGMYPGKDADIARAMAEFGTIWGRADDSQWGYVLPLRARFIDRWRAILNAAPDSVTTFENVTAAFYSLVQSLPAGHLRGRTVLVVDDDPTIPDPTAIEAAAALAETPQTEGEAVADARRTPKMQAFVAGKATDLEAYQAGSLTALPELPTAIDAASTATYIQSVLNGESPVPAPIAEQVAHILQLHQAL